MVRGHLIGAALIAAALIAAAPVPAQTPPSQGAAQGTPVPTEAKPRKAQSAHQAMSKVMPHKSTHDIMMPEPATPPRAPPSGAPPSTS